jgi:predicted dehydrogenase
MAKEIRVGLIGCGGIMQRHINHLLAIPEAKITAMADPNPKCIARYKSSCPSLASAAEFTGYKDLFGADLDAVVIASPHTAHAQQIVDSLGHGLHVMCEKPMVTSVADAVRVMKAERKAKRVLLLAYQRHWENTFCYIKKTIASGELGTIDFIQAFQSQEWKWIANGTWRADPKLSGFGQLSDSGSHLLDAIMWTTGLKPASVAAKVDYSGMKVDINSAVTVEFEGGAIGNISILGSGASFWEDITISGTKGTIFMRNGVVNHKVGIDGEMRVVSPAGPAWFQPAPTPARNFIDCILGKAQNESPSASGLRVVEICQTAIESAKAGGKMTKVPRTKV